MKDKIYGLLLIVSPIVGFLGLVMVISMFILGVNTSIHQSPSTKAICDWGDCANDAAQELSYVEIFKKRFPYYRNSDYFVHGVTTSNFTSSKPEITYETKKVLIPAGNGTYIVDKVDVPSNVIIKHETSSTSRLTIGGHYCAEHVEAAEQLIKKEVKFAYWASGWYWYLCILQVFVVIAIIIRYMRNSDNPPQKVKYSPSPNIPNEKEQETFEYSYEVLKPVLDHKGFDPLTAYNLFVTCQKLYDAVKVTKARVRKVAEDHTEFQFTLDGDLYWNMYRGVRDSCQFAKIRPALESGGFDAILSYNLYKTCQKIYGAGELTKAQVRKVVEDTAEFQVTLEDSFYWKMYRTVRDLMKELEDIA